MQLALNRPQRTALAKILRNGSEPIRDTVLVLPWGRGVGKSFFVRKLWWLLVARWDGVVRPGATQPGVRIVMLMPSYRQARAVHFRDILSELYGDWAFLGGVLNRSSLEMSFPGGSTIRWVTAENPAGARGIRCDIAFVDECDDVPIEMYDAVCVPWLTEHHSFNIRVLCGTPRMGRSGLLWREYDAALSGVDGAHAVHATYLDALEHVKLENVERHKATMPEAWFRREYLCDFDSAEGLVYPEFKPLEHIKPYPDGRKPQLWLMGVDFGTAVATCYLAIAYDGINCHVVDEVYEIGLSNEQMVEKAVVWSRKYPNGKWMADYSWPTTLDYVRRNARIQMREADKSVADGILTVGSWFKQDRLLIDPRCKNLIKELGSYRWTSVQRDDGRFQDKPVKKNDHAVDALRYALHTQFGTPSRSRVELVG